MRDVSVKKNAQDSRVKTENAGFTMLIPSRSLFRVVNHSSKIEFQQN